MAFYEIFESLCKERGVSPTRAARDNGLKQQSVSSWKKRGSTPKAETVQKLADYFGVSVDYLLGQNCPPASTDFATIHRFDLTMAKEYRVGDIEGDGPMLNLPINFKAYETFHGKARARINEAVNQMTPEGQVKVADYAEDILPRYRAETGLESTPAPQEGKDTTPPPDAPETPPEGE